MTTAIVILGYLVIVGGMCYWRLRVSKGRAGRNPIGDDKKLMRQPGEALRRRMAGLDER